VVVLMDVPHQPLFGGMVEDELIAKTFDEFMKARDAELLSILPMVKSGVRAMDAVQQFCQKTLSFEVGRFTVTGASKRGWTTWLAGASDDRIR
jgi:PhoPQ-activated pathogenicity-related protein